jgi:phage terminase large subunit
VWQEWVVDQDDRLFRVREIYHTRRLVEDHAARIRELTRGNPPPVAILCDHDAEDRATLERHLGYETSPAVKAVSAGIQSVAERLRRAGDGRPRLFLMRDSLDQRDIELEASKRPCCTEEEWDAYIWDLRQGRGKGDLPIKENDHGLDALRYLVYTIDSTLDA